MAIHFNRPTVTDTTDDAVPLGVSPDQEAARRGREIAAACAAKRHQVEAAGYRHAITHRLPADGTDEAAVYWATTAGMVVERQAVTERHAGYLATQRPDKCPTCGGSVAAADDDELTRFVERVAHVDVELAARGWTRTRQAKATT